MLDKQMRGLSANKLRYILALSIVLWILVGATGFWFFRTQLNTYAIDVKTASDKASKSSRDVDDLKKLEQYLSDNDTLIKRTAAITSDAGDTYNYQETIYQDINAYAKKTGVKISSYSFSAVSTGTTPGASTPAAPTVPVAPTAPGAPAAPVAGAGLKSTTASIALAGENKYENIMNFIHYIERNLTKMQLSGISLSKQKDNDNVTIGAITIEVYLK